MPEIFNAAKTKPPAKPIHSRAPSGAAEDEGVPEQIQTRELEKIKRERPSSLFSSFLPHPRKWSFETQESEEKIILVLRRHWITNVGWIIRGIILAVLPLVLVYTVNLPFIPLAYQLTLYWIWYLILTGFFLERFLDWFFNVFIITDERIVDFDFYGMIYKEISDAKIENIQDVTYKVAGFLPNLLDYGDVLIQTSAEIPQFEFSDVPQPARVARVLRELITEEEVEKIEGRVR